MSDQTGEVPVVGLRVVFVRPGENGSCQKTAGSGNCMYSITDCKCTGITNYKEVGGKFFATEVQCDSPHRCDAYCTAKLTADVLYQRRMGIRRTG